MCAVYSQVIYGSALTDPTSASTLSALTDHWIHTGGPRKEAGRYHIPAQFFTPGTRLSGLLQAVETAHPPLVPTPDLCGLYYSTMVGLSSMCINMVGVSALLNWRRSNS